MTQKFESKLLPIMREAIDVVKMIFFKKLKTALASKHAGEEASFAGMLTGAMVNEIFGTPSQEEPFASFARENKAQISAELAELAFTVEELRIPVTDALRMQSLCDHQEGIKRIDTLIRAEELGILITNRDLPLPHSFISLVRKLGSVHGLIVPPLPPQETNIQ